MQLAAAYINWGYIYIVIRGYITSSSLIKYLYQKKSILDFIRYFIVFYDIVIVLKRVGFGHTAQTLSENS